MPRERHKTPGIGQHADKGADQPHGRQRGESLQHPFLLIVEPPSGTELKLALDASRLEIPDRSSDHFVMRGIQAVHNGFRRLIVPVEPA